MSPAFEEDWSKLREGDRVNLYLKDANESNWKNVTVSDVDDEGKFIKVRSKQGGYPRDTLHRATYDVERL